MLGRHGFPAQTRLCQADYFLFSNDFRGPAWWEGKYVLGQGTGEKQLSSASETAPALAQWQKLGLSGLKPGRGALSGGADLCLAGDRLDTLPRHFQLVVCFQP